MRVVGLGGGIASGKSTVSSLLRKEGFVIIDCDVIAKEVVRKGRWGYNRVVRAFGTQVLRPDGELNRPRLGEIVFNDPTARRKLNQATHLPVFVELFRQLLWFWISGAPVVIVDMPLLYETGTYKWTKPSVLVMCDEATQVKRLMARDGLTHEQAIARIKSQMPLEKKLALADVILSNSTSQEELQHQVQQLALQLRDKKARWR